MKQFNLLPAKALVFLCAFFMVACEDDEEKPKANPLVGGTWQWTISEWTNCGEPENEGEYSLTNCTYGCNFYEFKADGTVKNTFLMDESSKTVIGVYTLEDSHLIICFNYRGTEDCDSGEITVSGDQFDWFIQETDCDTNRIFEKI